MIGGDSGISQQWLLESRKSMIVTLDSLLMQGSPKLEIISKTTICQLFINLLLDTKLKTHTHTHNQNIKFKE